MAELPSTYPDPIPIAIVGGTGLSSLPSPPFTPLARLPPFSTPWGFTSSPIAVLSYLPPSTSTSTSSETTADSAAKPKPITIAFLARHGLHHEIAPHEVPFRANVAALRKLGVRCAIGFSAVGSLKEEVRPRDFVVVDQYVDWTKGLRPRTFFEGGVVGHVSMADPYDRELSALIAKAVGKEGVLQGGVKLHENGSVVCIEGPQFSTRSESLLFRTLPYISCINMSACPEASLFREAEIAYSLLCMSTDYDSWHPDTAAVDVEMVMGHMRHNGLNARRAVEAILEALSGGSSVENENEGGEGEEGKEEEGKERKERRELLSGRKWEGAVGVVTSTVKEAVEEVRTRDKERGKEGQGEGEGKVERTAKERLAWLFEGRFTE